MFSILTCNVIRHMPDTSSLNAYPLNSIYFQKKVNKLEKSKFGKKQLAI